MSQRLKVLTQVRQQILKIFNFVKTWDQMVMMTVMMILAILKKMRMTSYKLAQNRWRQLAHRQILISFKKTIVILHNLSKLLQEEERTRLPEKRQSLILIRNLGNKLAIISNKYLIKRITKDRYSLIIRWQLLKNGVNSQNQKYILVQRYTLIECIQLDVQVSRNFPSNFSKLRQVNYQEERVRRVNFTQQTASLQVIVMALDLC